MLDGTAIARSPDVHVSKRTVRPAPPARQPAPQAGRCGAGGVTRHAAAVAALLVLLAGCDAARQMRQAAHPQDFHYLTRAETGAVMRRLLDDIRALDHVLVEPVDAAEVIAALDALRADAAGLKPGPGGVRPSFIDDRLDAFRDRLDDARRAAQARPPDFGPALTVVDACARCHRGRR